MQQRGQILFEKLRLPNRGRWRIAKTNTSSSIKLSYGHHRKSTFAEGGNYAGKGLWIPFSARKTTAKSKKTRLKQRLIKKNKRTTCCKQITQNHWPKIHPRLRINLPLILQQSRELLIMDVNCFERKPYSVTATHVHFWGRHRQDFRGRLRAGANMRNYKPG